MTFEEFRSEWLGSDDRIKVNTSGSTGSPKEIFLYKEFLKESAKRTNTFFKITSKSRIHSCVSADYIGGKMMLVRAYEANCLFTSEKPSNQPLRDIPKTAVLDLVAMVPSQVAGLLESQQVLPEIKNIIIGGSAIHPDLKRKIVNSGLNAYETYGMTETASHIALRKITHEDEPFVLLPGIKIAADVDNSLIICFQNGYEVHTNDIVEILSEKEFYIKGRKDWIIISGGKKINPLTVESKLSHIISKPFIITGVADEKWGEKIILKIEGEAEEFDLEILKNQITEIVEPWEKPKEIIFTDSLPRTPNGKILRTTVE